MKTFFTKSALYLALTIPAFFFLGCDDSEEGGSYEFSVEPTVLTFSAKQETQTLSVRTYGDWSIVLPQDAAWLKVSAMSGRGPAEIEVTAENYYRTDTSRTARLTVTGGNSGDFPVEVVQQKLQMNDLSAAGKANCYIVPTSGDFVIDAATQGNSESEQVGEWTSAELLWEDNRELITDLYGDPESKRIFFSTAAAGNAVIAVKDASGKILWSWHIWYPEAEVAGLNSKTGYEVMNMNLGAMHNTPGDVGSYGLLYQWGRKDPFPAAPTLTGTTATVGAPIYDGDNNEIKITNSSQSSTADNNLAFAIANPTVCLSNYAQFNTSRDWLQADMSNDALWGNPKGAERNETNDFLNKGAKSFYDPCPVGWRVPPADVFRNFTASGGYAWVIDDFDIADISGDGAKSLADYDYGWTFNLSDSASSYFPAAARFDGSYAMLMGSMSGLWGSYWGNAPYPGDMFQGGAYSVLSFQIKDTAGNEMITTSPAGGGARADAYSVRCIRE